MKAAKGLHVKSSWLLFAMVVVAIFASNVNAAAICTESDLMEALGKVAHKSGLTKELESLKGKWSSAVKMRADAEHPWTHAEGEDLFSVTEDGHHLKHESTIGQEKKALALLTYDSQQRKYVAASCDSSGAAPVTTVGTFANATFEYKTSGKQMTTTLRDHSDMVSKVSLIKKDTPQSKEAREITIVEVTYKREP
jgi:uncharacterized cupredoxin-like copper-binding protein